MQPTSFTCDRCRAPLPPGVMACPNCGQAFAAPVPSPTPPQYGQPNPQFGQPNPQFGQPNPAYVQPMPVKKGMPTVAIVGLIGAFGCLPFIAIFAAILFPVFAKVREKARETSSMSNLRIIGLAVMQYSEDHNENYPPTDSIDDFKAALAPYTKDSTTDLYTEPGYAQPYVLNPSISRESMASVANPAATEVAREPVAHGDGLTAVLYGDGHVGTVNNTIEDQTNTN